MNQTELFEAIKQYIYSSELSDRDVVIAIKQAIDEFNSQFAVSQYTTEQE